MMLEESSNKAEIQERVNTLIIDLAKRGYRTIGVAISDAEGKRMFDMLRSKGNIGK